MTGANIVICPDCGANNTPGDRFCAECGGYLDWAEQPVAAVSGDGGAAHDGKPDTTAEERLASATAPADSSPIHESPKLPAQEMLRHEQLSQPQVGQEPVAISPAAPKLKVAPPRQRPGSADPEAGSLICGQCGTGNAPHRKFCRQCANSLSEAPQVARLSWWRRIFGAGRALSRQTSLPAGLRPRISVRRFPTRMVSTVAVLGLLAGGGYLAREPLLAGVGFVQDKLIDSNPIRPQTIAASSATEGHPAELAIDGAVNKAWQPAATTDGVGEFLSAQFDLPCRLVYLQIRAGVSEQAPDFLASGRPLGLKVELSLSDGRVRPLELDLADKPGNQQFYIGQDNVLGVKITVRTSVPGSAEPRIAINEVEYLGRR